MTSLHIHVVFPFITVAGLYMVSNLMVNSGHAQLFTDSRSAATPLLPDGKTPLKTCYTGIPSLDSYLANLQFSIIPTVDGSSAPLSLLGWHWMGLLLAVFTVMLIESLRTRRVRDLVLFIFWGLAIQYAGYFIIMPLYCYVHLLSSPGRNAKVAPTSAAIHAVTYSVFIGLVVPSVAMCLSDRFYSGQTRQLAVAIWQNFPAWIATTQIIATAVINRGEMESEKPEAAGDGIRSSASARRRLYELVAATSALIHILGLLPILLAVIDWPESLKNGSLLPSAFFLPPRWDSTVQVSCMADGAFNFLRYDYYIGTAAALAWVLFLQPPDLKSQGFWLRSTKVLWDIACTVLLGPGYTIVSLTNQADRD